MCSRRELESLIVFGLQEVRKLEGRLKRKWSALEKAPPDAQVSFMWSLAEFEEQASRLEKLIETLEEPVYQTAPLAA